MRLKAWMTDQNYSWPVKNSAAAIADGALLMPGVTAETDDGVLIPATTACGDAIGVLTGAVAATDTNTLVAGTAWLIKQVTPVPMAVFEVDYDLTDTAAVASTSGTTVTITSLEDNIDTGWLYAVTGSTTAAGGLYFIATSASGSCVTKSATAWDSGNTVIKLLPLFHQVAKINSTSDKIGTDAAAGSWTCLILQNWLCNNVYGAVALDPTKHSGLTGLSAAGLGTRFYADVAIRNAGPYTVD